MIKRSKIDLKSFLLLVVALFLFVALLSHHPHDPSWTYWQLNHHFFNLEGALGAWVSDALLSLLGYGAYLVPILFVYYALQHTHLSEKGRLCQHIWCYCLGYLLCFSSYTGLIALAFPNKSFLPMGSGGILGVSIAWYLTLIVGVVGAYLLLISCLVVGAYCLRDHFLFNGLQSFGRKMSFQEKGKSLLQKYASNKEDNNHGSAKTLSSKPMVKGQEKGSVKSNNTTYRLPAINLLDYRRSNQKPSMDPNQLLQMKHEVNSKLLEFNIKGEVADAHVGPVITRFEYQPDPGTKVSKITSIATDLARSLSVSSVRIVEVIPGKSTIGIELPNEKRCIVSLRDLLSSEIFQSKNHAMPLALGKDISGNPQVVDLAKMPHLLIAGTTGSGKSVGINGMILSLLYRFTPNDLRMIMIDPKMLELSIYEGIPHLLTPVVTNMNDASHALQWCVNEMERRYQVMAALGVRNISGYNNKILEAEKMGKPIMDPLHQAQAGNPAKPLKTFPFIVVVVDELADMMMVVGKKVEHLIVRIAQKARAAGIHLILATQRPSVNVLTGLIKSNMPTRIAFQVSSKTDSRIILERAGAEALLGAGDMLYVPPGSAWPMRIHGAFVDDHEVHAIVKAWQRYAPPDQGIQLQTLMDEKMEPDLLSQISSSSEVSKDPLFEEALDIVLNSQKASISYLQRRLKIGFNRAATLIESMEEKGVLSAPDEKGKRQILSSVDASDEG